MSGRSEPTPQCRDKRKLNQGDGSEVYAPCKDVLGCEACRKLWARTHYHRLWTVADGRSLRRAVITDTVKNWRKRQRKHGGAPTYFAIPINGTETAVYVIEDPNIETPWPDTHPVPTTDLVIDDLMRFHKLRGPYLRQHGHPPYRISATRTPRTFMTFDEARLELLTGEAWR